ncbi:hypothetical protein T484DRAFT_1778743 [Baffinella frigidus]|nr:hypothetical protein T484DRAFT_1778743 [Cryptophyta sp. CCMP2293]
MPRRAPGPATAARVCRGGACVAPFSPQALLLLLAATAPHCALPRAPASEHLSRPWSSLLAVRQLADCPEAGSPSSHDASSAKGALGGASLCVALRGGNQGLRLEDEDEELLPEVDADVADEGGEWKWEIPHGGPEDTSVLHAWGNQEDYSAETARKCMYDRMNCQDALAVQGVSAAALNGSWVAFFCKECAPHLAVRKNAQVPVTWGAEANETLGLLTMLPLYKRCRQTIHHEP